MSGGLRRYRRRGEGVRFSVKGCKHEREEHGVENKKKKRVKEKVQVKRKVAKPTAVAMTTPVVVF